MKKTFLLLSMLFISMPLAAQNSSLADLNKRVDEISAPVMDIEARYWAGRVQSGSITIEEIEKNSKNWLGSESAKNKEISKIKKYLKSGKTVSVTEQERQRMDESTRKIRELMKNNENAAEKRLKEVDAIKSKVRDIKARELALGIKAGKYTVKNLREESKNWTGTAKGNKELVDLAVKYSKSKKTVSISEEEWDKLDENNRKVRTFLNNGKETDGDKALLKRNKKIRKVQEEVFELDARYWANRVAVVKNVTMEDLSKSSLNWVGERSYNQKLINRISENIKTGNTAALTDKEMKKLDKANEKVRNILKK